MAAPTPAQVLDRRRHLILSQDTEGFISLFAPDSVIELPFAGPDMPSRFVGQQEIREFARRTTTAAFSALRIDDLEATALHHTHDPEVVIVELVTRGTLTATGRAFATSAIQVFRIRDGKILLFRDYFNPDGLKDVLGA